MPPKGKHGRKLSNIQAIAKIYNEHPEIRKMKKVFDDVDVSGDTRLDKKEFLAAIDKLFPLLTKITVAERGPKAWDLKSNWIYTQIDTDKSNDLSWQELINFSMSHHLADEWWMNPKDYEKMVRASWAQNATKDVVPETLLKKRRTAAAVKAKREIVGVEKKNANKKLRQQALERAKKYAAEYAAKELATIEAKRSAKTAGNYFVEPEAKVLLVIRIRGINRLAPKPKKILQLFRLRQLNNAVFLKANHATLTMLKCIEPYVTYGEPNLKTVRELLYKRGHGKVERQRIPLNSNKVISANLGKFDIVCMEDLVHEIVTCGPNFKAANNFLWPIKLSNPLGGWTNKGLHYSEGGDGGRREEAINALARRMNGN